MRRRHRRRASKPFVTFAPPGHFYSPLPDMTYVEGRRERLFDRAVEAVPGIDNRDPAQLDLLGRFSQLYGELPFTAGKSEGLRYYFDNDWFGHGDAIVLYSMMRHYRPKRVVEIGSGYSSAVMLDTNDRFLEGRVSFTFVEPYPERLYSLLSAEDRGRCEVLVHDVQDVSLETFTRLEAGDILFIDSSHVAKIGSDVVHLLTNVLPRLRPGVIVGFHDILWPFEYPEAWVREGRAWNESYVLRAFLQFNAVFRVLFFNSYLSARHGSAMERSLPLFAKNPGGSLWIEKTA